MKKLLMLTSALALLTGNAIAAGTHSGGHGEMMVVGEPGDPSEINRSIEVTMRETDDGDMIFEPNNLDIKKGETIRFTIKNAGELDHEFVLDGHHEIMKHKMVMEKFPEMEHDDPNSVRLEPGEEGEIIWKFSKDGGFEFACLIPGHYDAGMRGAIKVAGH